MADRLARRLGVPFVVTEHSRRYLEPLPAQYRMDWLLARRAARRAARLLPVSHALAAGMQRHGIHGHYRVLPNSVDEATFFPPTAPPAGPLTFLHLSDFSPVKRVPELLTAFAIARRALPPATPPPRLLVAGDGDPRPLERHLATLGLPPGSVGLRGPLPRPGVAELMRSADYFLLNSRIETQSVVLLEALCSGLPCINAAPGGAAGVIDRPLFGRNLPPGDGAALAEAIRRATEEGREPLARRRERAGAAVLHYGGRAVLTALDTVYRGII